jgi:hypothetical protein
MGHVHGYRRRDGTYVRGHYRRNPSSAVGGGLSSAIGAVLLAIFVLMVLMAIINGAT